LKPERQEIFLAFKLWRGT